MQDDLFRPGWPTILRQLGLSNSFASAFGPAYRQAGSASLLAQLATRSIPNSYVQNKNTQMGVFILNAGAEGIEPPIKVLETSVIPLHHAPKQANGQQIASRFLLYLVSLCKVCLWQCLQCFLSCNLSFKSFLFLEEK